MVSFRASNLLAFILAASAVLVASAQSHHLFVGEREPGDRNIYSESIAIEYNWTGKKIIEPRNITAPYGSYITRVECWDQATDGTGAEPSITYGGPKNTRVELRLKSQRWHGIYFKIEVYGKRRY